MEFIPVAPSKGGDRLFHAIHKLINGSMYHIEDYFNEPGYNEFLPRFNPNFFKDNFGLDGNKFLPEKLIVGCGYTEDKSYTVESFIERTRKIIRSGKQHGAKNISVFLPLMFGSRQEMTYEERDAILKDPHQFIEEKLQTSEDYKVRLSQGNNIDKLLKLKPEERIQEFPDYAREINRLSKNAKKMLGSIDSLNMLIEDFYNLGVNSIVTVDVHNEEATRNIVKKYYGEDEGIFYNIDSTPLFADFVMMNRGKLGVVNYGENLLIPALDKGAYEKSRKLRKLSGFKNASIAYCDKIKSNKVGGRAEKTIVVKLDDPLNRDKPVYDVFIPPDDIGDSFNSLVNVVNACVDEFNVPVYILSPISHGVLQRGDGYNKIAENHLNIVLTNSRPNLSYHFTGRGRKNINVLDLAPVAAKVIMEFAFKNKSLDDFSYAGMFKVLKEVSFEKYNQNL